MKTTNLTTQANQLTPPLQNRGFSHPPRRANPTRALLLLTALLTFGGLTNAQAQLLFVGESDDGTLPEIIWAVGAGINEGLPEVDTTAAEAPVGDVTYSLNPLAPSGTALPPVFRAASTISWLPATRLITSSDSNLIEIVATPFTFTYTARDSRDEANGGPQTASATFTVRVCQTTDVASCPPIPRSGGGGDDGGSSNTSTILTIAAIGGGIYWAKRQGYILNNLQPFALPLGEDSYVVGFNHQTTKNSTLRFTYGENKLDQPQPTATARLKWQYNF